MIISGTNMFVQMSVRGRKKFEKDLEYRIGRYVYGKIRSGVRVAVSMTMDEIIVEEVAK